MRIGNIQPLTSQATTTAAIMTASWPTVRAWNAAITSS
jgi:hypothetical protein